MAWLPRIVHLQIARDIFPSLSDQELDAIIWEDTGYPGFFDLKDSESIVDVFKRQLLEYRDKQIKTRQK